jgi:predicted DNA-binding transcriptional regulator AlpA
MLSTTQVARKLGIAPKTLSRYIAAGKVPAPTVVQVGGLRAHAWDENDVEQLRKLLPKIANGRKTRYQKLRDKQKGTKTRKKSKP